MSSDGESDAITTEPPKSENPALSAPGKITSAILSKDDPIPDDLDDDDDDEDIVKSRKRGKGANGVAGVDVEDELPEDEAEDDLFGDDTEDKTAEDASKRRQLDDEELDSGDDMDRHDRIGSGSPAAEQDQQREELVQYSEFGRQPEPEPSDGEMYLLKVPEFLSIESTMFDTPSFRIPEREHHSRQEPPPTFSAFNTAMSTVRWRHSPSDPAQLQSNARILRWSDGSLTLQLASDPSQQYEIDGNALAPTQKNPSKPTPVTKKPSTQETYTYLTAPHENVGLLRVTHKITAGLSILPSQKTTDAALERLQSSLAAAVRGKGGNATTGIEMVAVSEDPELGRKKAELAEREKMRAQKRREAAEARDRERGGRALGRAGLTSSRYGYGGGLSASMLEDDEGGARAPRATKPKSRRPRNDEYSSDEDLGRRRGNFANDDYEVDDFVAGSDEEEEEPEDDDDDEEDIDDGIVLDRDSSNKRSRAPAVEDDQDAEGEEDDDDVRAAAPKAKRRRAVVDDEDEDE